MAIFAFESTVYLEIQYMSLNVCQSSFPASCVILLLRLGGRVYQEASKKIADLVLTFARRTNPVLSGNTPTILPSGRELRYGLSLATKATSPVAKFL